MLAARLKTASVRQMKKFDITQGIAYYIGADIKTDKHSHHALEFIFGLEKPFDFYTSDAEFKNIYGVLVAPDVVHQFIGNKSEYLFVFLEPELLQSKEIMDFYQLKSFKTKELSSLTSKVNTNEILNFSFFISGIFLVLYDIELIFLIPFLFNYEILSISAIFSYLLLLFVIFFTLIVDV